MTLDSTRARGGCPNPGDVKTGRWLPAIEDDRRHATIPDGHHQIVDDKGILPREVWHHPEIHFAARIC